ncbi:MAG: hypothetical protein AAF394_11825 [Planctomycetota bacterium]
MLKYALLFTMLFVGSQAHAQSLFVKRQSDRASEEVLKKLFPEAPVVGLRTLLATVDGEKCVMTYGYPGKQNVKGKEVAPVTRSLKLTLKRQNSSTASKVFDQEIWKEIQKRRASDRLNKAIQQAKRATEYSRNDWNRIRRDNLPEYGDLSLLMLSLRESLQVSLSPH